MSRSNGAGRVATAVVASAATAHLAGAAVLFGAVAVAAEPLDGGVHGASVLLALGTPAVLALMGVRGRWPLVLAAALCSAALAVVPFSAHSLVLAPLAAVYTVGYLGNPTRPPLSGRRTVGALAVLPLLAVPTVVAPALISNPLCYQQTSDGEVRYYRPQGPTSTGSQVVHGDVVRGGCTSKAPHARDSAIRSTGFAFMATLGLVLVQRNGLRSAHAEP